MNCLSKLSRRTCKSWWAARWTALEVDFEASGKDGPDTNYSSTFTPSPMNEIAPPTKKPGRGRAYTT